MKPWPLLFLLCACAGPGGMPLEERALRAFQPYAEVTHEDATIPRGSYGEEGWRAGASVDLGMLFYGPPEQLVRFTERPVLDLPPDWEPIEPNVVLDPGAVEDLMHSTNALIGELIRELRDERLRDRGSGDGSRAGDSGGSGGPPDSPKTISLPGLGPVPQEIAATAGIILTLAIAASIVLAAWAKTKSKGPK